MPSGNCADLVTVLVAAAVLAGQAPPPAPRGGIVEGTVTNRVNGQPLRKAVVGLRSAASTDTYLAPVDSNGRFRIQGVLPGSYHTFAQAEHFSYLPVRMPIASPPIAVAEGERVTDVNLQMTPLAVISGRVLDPDGDPVSNASVEAIQGVYRQGGRQLGPPGRRTISDDRGQYRLFDLPPGRYHVRASKDRRESGPSMRGPVRGPRLPEGYALTYYPNAREPGETAPVEIAPGGEVRDIDIRMFPAVFYSVRGTLQGLADPQSRPLLRIQRRSTDGSVLMSGFSITTSGDSFEFMNLLPGSYVIVAERREGERAVARQVVEVVDADVEGINLTFSPAVELRGVVRATGLLKQPIEGRQIVASSMDFGMPGNTSAEVKPDGSFAFRNLLPDVYRLEIPRTPGAYLKSLRIGQQEVQGREIDLTRGSAEVTILLGTDGGRLEGQVVNARGEPVAGALLTLPSLTRGGGIRTAMADAKGAFKMEDLAPGDYRLFAWQDAEPGAPVDPEFRKPYVKQALPIQVAPNSTQTVKVTAISVK